MSSTLGRTAESDYRTMIAFSTSMEHVCRDSDEERLATDLHLFLNRRFHRKRRPRWVVISSDAQPPVC